MDELFEQLASEYGIEENKATGIIDTVINYVSKNKIPENVINPTKYKKTIKVISKLEKSGKPR